MTRREEVEASIKSILHFAENFRIESDGLQHLARNLADEVDALRAEADPDALTICYMQGQAAGRDAERAENAELNATLDKLRASIEDQTLDNNELAEKMLSLLYPELENTR